MTDPTSGTYLYPPLMLKLFQVEFVKEKLSLRAKGKGEKSNPLPPVLLWEMSQHSGTIYIKILENVF